MNEFPGEIQAVLLDIRFAYSGSVSRVFKQRGDAVKKGDCIASLDRKFLQIELDRQLAQASQIGANFELFSIKYGKGPDSDDTIKYLRQVQQAQLDASVKDIETAKFKMDQADLFSPANGMVIDMQGLLPGLNITPASNPITILDGESVTFDIEVPQEELFQFTSSRIMKVTFPGKDIPYVGVQKLPTSGKKGLFIVPIVLEHPVGLYTGMSGTATFKLD